MIVLGPESKKDGITERLLANAEYRWVANFRELAKMMIIDNMALGREGKLGCKLLPTVGKAHAH
jgi:hypothetical protein